MQTFEQLLWVLRAGGVSRFHCHEVNKVQNIAEHSWQVAIITNYIAPGSFLATIMSALLHDVGEFETGDVPAPVKRASPIIANMFDAMEINACREKGGLATYHLSSYEKTVIKAADSLSGMYYCYTERRKGNVNLRDAFYRYVDYVRELKDCPERALQLCEHLVGVYEPIDGK